MRKLLNIGAALLALLPLAAAAQTAGDLVQRGAYLTHAADCAACHSVPGHPAFTGGRAFVTPFGTLYSPNITPDAATGIGGYSDDDWVRMLHQGVGRGGRHLYPAMPYNSFTLMTREDALAIKAYLFSLPPVHAVAPDNQMSFPFDQRWLMVFWNLLNNPDRRFQLDTTRSAEWNRGAYLVEALGHCTQCHTPRDITQGLRSSKAYAGTEQQGWLAYNITSDRAAGVGGWSDAALAQYLSTGHADGHGPASGPMAEAVEDSLRYLTPADISAMVAYIRSIPAQPDGALPPSASQRSGDALGAHIFAQACAGCHLASGTGRQSPWAALAGDHTASDPAGTNLLQVLVNGTQIETAQGLMFMHGFTAAYTDPELAAVANYVIGQFGGRAGKVTAEDVRRARGGPDTTAPPALTAPEYAAGGAGALIILVVAGWLLSRRHRRAVSGT
jgi:mono/diheme cytochrome c family protein